MIQALSPLLLVASDDAQVRRIEGVLGDDVSCIRRARTLQEALSCRTPRLCLLDLSLPDASGLDALRRYRASEGEVPVVVLCEAFDPALVRASLEGGAVDCLPESSLNEDLLPTLLRAQARHEQTSALRGSVNRLRELVAAVPDMILEIDRDGRVLMANQAALDGVDEESLLGHSWKALVPPAQLAQYDEARERAFVEGKAQTLETPVPDAHGETTWLHVAFAPMKTDGVVARCVVLCRDITEERRQRERFRRALEAAPGGMLLVDRQGTIVIANRTVERVFGYDPDELVGSSMERLVPQDVHARHVIDRQAYVAAPRPRGMAGGRAVSGVSKDGSLIPLEISLAPLGTNGSTEVLCSIVDLRDRRALEEQLRQSQKLEALGMLSGGIAHDFNNLLSAILTFGDFVQAELEVGSGAREDMNEVLAAARRATSLTSQLLAFSRRQPIAPEVVSLAELCDELRKLLVRVIGEDIRLETSLDTDSHPVLVDPGTIEHVLLNLAVNARDAMPGGGTLEIVCHDVELDAAALRRLGVEREPGLYVRLRVSDAGQGIDAETRERIFEPFFTTKPMGRGTGLGLSTVYGIVTQARGFVTVQSEVGVGTTFDLWFPPAPPDAELTTEKVPGDPTPGSERILLVEDDPQLRSATSRSLRRLGYRVVAVASGGEAIEAAEGGETFDLVLTDLVMPDMNGAALAERLAERLATRFLFMTGYAPESIRQRGIVARGEVIQKPFGTAELTATIRSVLDAKGPALTTLSS